LAVWVWPLIAAYATTHSSLGIFSPEGGPSGFSCKPGPVAWNLACRPEGRPRSSYRLRRTLPIVRWLFLLRYPIVRNVNDWYGNINPFPITYAFRPQLRDRLTLSRLTLPRKPKIYGEVVFHHFYRYSYRHDPFCFVDRSLRSGFNLQQNAPLPLPTCVESPSLRCQA